MNPCTNFLLAMLPHQEKRSFSVFNNIQSLKIHCSLKVVPFSNVDRLHRSAPTQVMWSHILESRQSKLFSIYCTFQLSCLYFILHDVSITGMHVGNHSTDLEMGQLENYKLCLLYLYSGKRKLF